MAKLRKLLSVKHHYPNASFVVVFLALFFIGSSIAYVVSKPYIEDIEGMTFVRGITHKEPLYPPLDKEDYDKRLFILANRPFATSTATTTTTHRWPVKTEYPRDGAILPFKRIIAFYGNLLSTKMGVLGEYPEAEMFAKLDSEVATWSVADPTTEVIPALHYIAVTAQASPGFDGMYRARMSHKEIDKVITLAEKRDALVFLDFQVGLSTIQQELPLLDKYLILPQVHVGIDPEFSMKTGARPGTKVGTYDASDINFVIEHLAKIVKDNNLPPKILVVHRYTEKMVTNYQNIRPVPEVQVIIHMDGWGGPAHKKSTYQAYVATQPVQFAGFKLFYKNDRWNGFEMLTPHEILKLTPRPVYIQYQ